MAQFPQLLNLPSELHIAIAKNLDFPDNMTLRMANRHFYNLIRPLTYDESLRAELITLSALNKELFACIECLRLRPGQKFVERDAKDGNTHVLFLNGKQILPVPYCIDCACQWKRCT